MNPIIAGLIRHFLTALGGGLVTKGLTDSAGVEQIVGAVITIIGILWSVRHKKQVEKQSAAPQSVDVKLNASSKPGSGLSLLLVLVVVLVVAQGRTFAQESTNAPPPSVPAARGTLSAQALTDLIAAIKNATVLTTGYGIDLDGNKGVMFAQQLSLLEVKIKGVSARLGPMHATLFTHDKSIEEIGGGISWDWFRTPAGVASVVNAAKPITPNFSEVHGWLGVFLPADDVFNAEIDFQHATFGGGLGVAF